MAKKTINTDIYNLSKLVDDVKSIFIPEETEETLAIGTYGYIGALEAHRLQTQVQMTGELANEVFPSRARLERNIITHAIMANIEDINATPSKMTAFLAIRESDILSYFDPSSNTFIIDRECPFFIGDYEFHLEYDIKLKKVDIKQKKSTYTAQYIIPDGRDVPTSTITSSNQYLNSPTVVNVNNESFIYLSVILSQVEHHNESKKLVTANVIDNKTINFEFENQLAYFEIHSIESDQEYYILPVFEGSSVPESKSQYYCWYQYIDTNLIRVRFDRASYMPGLNATVECLVKTCKGSEGNFKFKDDVYVELESKNYGYKGVTCLLTPVSDASGGKDRKSKRELQSLIPKEYLSRGSLTTITDLNNYFGMLDSDNGRVVIQKKADNQIERVYYAYFVAKDSNDNILPSNTIDIYVDKKDLIESKITESGSSRFLLPAGSCFKLDKDGIGRVNHDPLIGSEEEFKISKNVSRGYDVSVEFEATINPDAYDYDSLSASVDVSGSSTPTLLFPGDKKYSYTEEKSVTELSNYMLLGFGKTYSFSTDYTVKNDNSIITIRDRYFDYMKFVRGYYYTSDPDNKQYFFKLPFVIGGFSKGTKITVGIERILTDPFGIAYFNLDNKQYKLHQKNNTRLSYILNNLGLSGEVLNAYSSDESIVSLDRIVKNNVLKRVGQVSELNNSLPPIQSSSENKNPYRLNITLDKDIPLVQLREENQWFYVIERQDPRPDDLPTDNISSSAVADLYNLHVVEAGKEPPVSERKIDDWYYIVTGKDIREVDPSDPDQPDDPGEITGKDYLVTVLDTVTEPVILTVDIDGVVYDITITQDRNLLENRMYITEDESVERIDFTAYIPILEQDKRPDEIVAGDIIKYKLTYRSPSNTFNPNVTIKLSRGLDYVPFSNKIIYPNGSIVSYEPSPIPVSNSELGFLYTNPYAININGSRLYSSFYMMSMNENQYLYFNVNDKSNVQFIGTNIYWNRQFSGYNKNFYTLSVEFTQSVQGDLGLVSIDEETNEITGYGVKAVAVFYRDGKPYRYRSLNLTDYSPETFSFRFEQSFYSEDVFDNDNNIKCSNFQVSSQSEYNTILSYEGKEISLRSGSYISGSELVRQFDLEGTINNIRTSDPSVLGVFKKDTDFKIESLSDFIGTESIYIDTSITDEEGEESIVSYEIQAASSNPVQEEYGFFNPNTEVKIYVLCNLPDIEGNYSRNDFDSICPGFQDWTLTNTYTVVNGVTFYYNYSEIMGSRIIPSGPRAASLKWNNEACLVDLGGSIKAYTLLNSLGISNKEIVNITSSTEVITITPDLNPDESVRDYTISITNDFKSKESLVITAKDSDGYEFVYNISATARDEYGNYIMNGTGYYIKNIPMLGYDYCQDEFLVQEAINALNYRKAYIESAVKLLENSFGIDFKLFNTYGPSKTYYIRRDSDKNNVLDDTKEYIDRVNITLYFRIRLLASNDSYTKNNIIKEIKEYIEDLDDLGEIHIPNLVTQITTNYKEQIAYFEYLGFNEYGPEIQHIYKDDDSTIDIHTAPEFINVNNVVSSDGTTTPDINIYVSEI